MHFLNAYKELKYTYHLMKPIDGSYGHFQGQVSGSVFSCVQNTLNPLNSIIIMSLPIDSFQTASGGKHMIKGQLYRGPFAFREAASFIFQH